MNTIRFISHLADGDREEARQRIVAWRYESAFRGRFTITVVPLFVETMSRVPPNWRTLSCIPRMMLSNRQVLAAHQIALFLGRMPVPPRSLISIG